MPVCIANIRLRNSRVAGRWTHPLLYAVARTLVVVELTD
jgi:hypothetical protein